MGTFVGRVTVLDEHEHLLGTVPATMASVESPESRWFGIILSDLGRLLHDGDQIVLRLPNGTESRAQAVIDLTGDRPVIRLRGIGRAPV